MEAFTYTRKGRSLKHRSYFAWFWSGDRADFIAVCDLESWGALFLLEKEFATEHFQLRIQALCFYMQVDW